MKSASTILFLLIFNFIQAQSIELNSFNKTLLGFEFKGSFDSRIWPSKNNIRSLVLIKEGEYSIHQKHTVDDDIIIPAWDNLYRNFEIQARIKIQESDNNNSTAGICFNMTKELNHGYILELNGEREFSVKKIIKPGKYLFISSLGSKNPWTKFKKMGKKEEYNTVSIMVKGNVVDIYINNYFAFSFIDDKSGNEIKNFGIYIGPASRAVVNMFNLIVDSNDSIPDINLNSAANNNDSSLQTYTGVDTSITNMIFNLRNQLEATKNELRDARILINRCKDDNLRLNEFISSNVDSKLTEKTKALQKQYDELKIKYDQLVLDNQTLETFKKDCIDKSKDKDMVKLLYDQLNASQKENEKLKQKIKVLEGK